MNKSTILFGAVISILIGTTLAGAQTFPPVTATGPFPKGTETKRNDAPVDSLRTASPMIYHEYTCYKVRNPPVIDGNIDSTDPVWSKIPWTLMTFWEAQNTERTITVFSGDTTDTWKGPKDCTGYFKMMWDDTNVYVAVKVYDDILNHVTDTNDLPQTDCKMYQHDCIQLSINSTPPNAQTDLAIDPFMGCELGVALATVYPLDSLRDTIDTTLYTYFPDTTRAADTTEAFTAWMPTNSNAGMTLGRGDNKRSNSIVKNKAIHITVRKMADYNITSYEFALRRVDSTAGYLWSPFIRDNAVGRLSIMAMDHDSKAVDSLEAVSWASGIITKNFNKFGSIKWSMLTPDGEEFPSATRSVSTHAASSPESRLLTVKANSIEYIVNSAGNVNLDLYTIAGKRVVSLVNQAQTPGRYHVQQATTGLSRGTYFCRLRVNSSETIHKLTVAH